MSEIIVTFSLISTRIPLQNNSNSYVDRTVFLGTNRLPHQDRHYCSFFISRLSVASGFIETLNKITKNVLFQPKRRISATAQYSPPQHPDNINTSKSRLYIQPHKHITDINYGVNSYRLHFINKTI